MVRSVVLVHGLRTSSSMWRHQRVELERHGYRVVTPDLPGHGMRMAERFTLESALETIAASVNGAPGGVFLCGFSLGGYLSLHYAGLEPRPIEGLLLASCGTRPYRVVLEAWRAAAAVIHALPDRGLALNNASVRLAIRDPLHAHDVIAGGVALEVMDDALRAMRHVHPLSSLAAVKQPIWLVNGTLDHFRLQERQYLRAAPNARLVHIAGATHMVSVARPVEFTRVLLDALQESAPQLPESGVNW